MESQISVTLLDFFSCGCECLLGKLSLEEFSVYCVDLQSPTFTISPTRAGTILGTAAYMSPEAWKKDLGHFLSALRQRDPEPELDKPKCQSH